MSVQLGNIAISTGKKTQFNGAPNTGVKAILIGNESGLTCTVTMESGNVSKTLYPSTVDWFVVKPGFSGNILITPNSILNNVSSFPSSSLVFDAIGLNDPEEASMYPLNLTRNTNVGNAISVNLPFFNVKDYGAKGDGVTDDTANITTAIGAVSATNGILDFPSGTYIITAGLKVTAPITLQGASAGSSILQAPAGKETLAMLTIGDNINTCADVNVLDLQFNSVNQKTANAAIKLQKCFRTHIERIRTQNQFRAIHVFNSTETWITNSDIRDTSENGLVFEATLGNGGDYFVNSCVADNPVASNTGAGISWLGGENLVIQNCDFIHFQTGCLIAPPTGQKSRFGFFVNAEFDSSSDNCIKIAPTGGDVIALTFTNGWSGTATNYGVLIDGSGGAGLLQGIRFIGHKALHNGLAGFRLTGGALDVHLSDCDVISNSQTVSNSRSGIEVTSTVGNNWSVVGCRCGNGYQQGSTQKYGINTDLATYTNVIIINNDLTGNATGGLNLNGATLTNSINTNNIS